MIPRPRHGFVLLAVLWVIAGLAVLAAGLVFVSRRATSSAANRVALTRAEWLAEGCLDEVRAAIDSAVAARGVSAWQSLDSVMRTSEFTALRFGVCHMDLRPTGTTIDVNTADERQLRALFLAVGVEPVRGDSLVDALLDWRDSDSTPRPQGAEREDYDRLLNPEPRNGPLVDVREMRLVRGFDALTGVDSLLGVEPGRIVLDRAPVAVLKALPGIDDEAIARVLEIRGLGARIGELPLFAATLPLEARNDLLAHLPELASITTELPEVWLVTASASAGTPRVVVEFEERLALSGTRAAVTRVKVTAR